MLIVVNRTAEIQVQDSDLLSSKPEDLKSRGKVKTVRKIVSRRQIPHPAVRIFGVMELTYATYFQIGAQTEVSSKNTIPPSFIVRSRSTVSPNTL